MSALLDRLNRPDPSLAAPRCHRCFQPIHLADPRQAPPRYHAACALAVQDESAARAARN